MAYGSIVKPSDYFDTRTYSASGAGSISDLNFQPDFIWFKNRTIVGDHGLFDAIRGVTKYLISNSNSTGLTGNGTSSDFLSFDTNGFSYGTSNQLDVGAGTPVTWCWKANGTGSANTDGSISSTVSANTTSGFSVVSYTGTGSNATIGHGLGSVPKMIIVKNLSSAYEWGVYHKSLGATQNIYLDSTGAAGNATFWNNTEPTSSVFNVGSTLYTNGSGQNYIAYCFAEIQGFSKFNSYVGNLNVDGTFVYTGFKPAFLIAKRTDLGAPWVMYDDKRDIDNPANHRLLSNSTNAELVEDANTNIDFLSNGFKLRNADTDSNASGGNYIYMAFAENPLVANSGTDGVPATAR